MSSPYYQSPQVYAKNYALLKKAVEQIKTNRYAAVFEGDSRPILSLGVGFLEKKRKGKVSELEIGCLLG